MDDSKSPSILIVEDSATQRMVMQVLCEKFGFAAFYASSGEEALQEVKSRLTCYDVILMDWRLPGMSGVKCAKIIRQLETGTNRRTPIVAVTARVLAGDRERCLEAGMDDYLSKPFTAEDLRAVILRWTNDAVRPIPVLPDQGI